MVVSERRYEAVVRQILALIARGEIAPGSRLPAERGLARLTNCGWSSTTVGLYDQNRLDGNMIIGNQPGRLDNFYRACGFSGHGLMHAPAVGRAYSLGPVCLVNP